MKPKDLTSVLKGAQPGEWVALSMDRSRIVGRGETAQAAREAAKGEEHVILFHVPFPNVGLAANASV